MKEMEWDGSGRAAAVPGHNDIRMNAKMIAKTSASGM